MTLRAPAYWVGYRKTEHDANGIPRVLRRAATSSAPSSPTITAPANSAGNVITRFPPEPNGYLHIGHAKSACLNFGLAAENGGHCNMRFDDTNPTREEVEYVNSILADVRWLGWDWGDNLFYASDYFGELYEMAVDLIRKGKAYVDDLTFDEIQEYRGTLTEPGRESPYRERSVGENLDLFGGCEPGSSTRQPVLRPR